MNPFAAYRAINTKLHAKKRTLLTSSEWQKMSECEQVSQIIDSLKKKSGYKEQMNLYKSNDLHRSDLEMILDRYCVNEIEDMLHYFSGSYKEFFEVFLMEYEISDLDLILRTISRKDEMKGIEKLFVHSEKWSKVQYTKLLSCKNTNQFVEALKDTKYYTSLRTLTNDDVLRREFHMEMKLYAVFYNELIEKASRLCKKDEIVARKMIGTKIDFLNAQWVYRALKYYDLSPEEILIYALSNGNKLKYHKLKRLCYSKSVDECKKMIENSLGYPLFKEENDAYLDCMTDRYLYKMACRIEKDDESIATSVAYIMLLNIEVNDLIALTEGVRYKLREGDLKKFIVHIT